MRLPKKGCASFCSGVGSRCELAKIELSYTKILAPIDGLIGISEAELGDFVGQHPNPVILNTVSQIDPIHVRTTISEQEYLGFARKFGDF